MLLLEKNAKLILTHYSGLQKGALILHVPCITVREETGWVETVESWSSKLVGADREKIFSASHAFLQEEVTKVNDAPYSDAHAAERIVEVVMEANMIRGNGLL